MTEPNDPYQRPPTQGGYPAAPGQGSYPAAPPPGGYPATPPGQGGYPAAPQPTQSGYPAPPPYGSPPPGYPVGGNSGHPVQLSIQRAPRQSRVLAFFSLPFFFGRLIMLIPATIVIYFVFIGLYFVAWFAQWAILFTGSYPEGMHRFATGVVRWQVRISAYLLGLTDKYPPFTTQP
jgi:hypothetical protein